MTDPAFAEVLAGLLSADGVQRKASEEKLEHYKTTERYGISLTEILIGLGYAKPLEQRQLAGTLLKQYIETHWSPASDKFKPPETTEEVKVRIRNQLLPCALKDPQKCVRIGGAYAMAAIAKYDWPEKWPHLFDLIGNTLRRNDPDLVHGAMHLLSELVTTVSPQQLQNMEDHLLSELRNIFINSETFSIEIRSRAVSIFATMASVVSNVTIGGCSKTLAQNGFYVHLRMFTDAMWKALANPDDGRVSDITLRTEIIKAFAVAFLKFPKQMQHAVTRVLPNTVSALETNAELYSKLIVDGSIDDDGAVDSEAVEQFIFALIDLIHAILGERRFSQVMLENVPALVFVTLIFMQIPEEKVEEWSREAQRYVEDEDVEMCITSVRMSAVDLLVSLCDSHPTETIMALWSAVARHLVTSNGRKEAGDNNWWKIREACYTALNCVAPNLLTIAKEKPDIMNIDEFLLNVLMPDIAGAGPIFLQGHAISFSGRIANAWGAALLKPLMEYCSSALQASNHFVIRISACRAFFSFCDEAKSSGVNLGQICDMKPVIASLVALGVRSIESVLNLVLATLLTVIQANPEAAIDSKVIPLITAAMLKFSGDPVIPSQVAEIVRVLMAVPACREKVENGMLPTVFSAIRCEDKSKLPIRLPAVALEVLEAAIRGSALPLSDAVIQNGFPNTVQCVLTSDDSHILAAGRECIRAFISKAPDQVLGWSDGVNTGVSLIVRIICHLLSPSTPELSASMVGRLIFVLLKRANDAISPYLEQILHAVLSKLYTSELSSIQQSLIMVFAHLIHYQLEPVFLFLSSVTTPDGTNALYYVLALWCEKQKAFFGSYDQKVSSLALCKVFLFAISSSNAALREMTVNDGEYVVDAATGNLTAQPQSVPLLVKILKLLIYELDSQLESRMKAAGGGNDNWNGDSEDENGGGDHASISHGDDVAQVLKDIVSGMQGEDDDISDENDDPDLADDAISSFDLVHELTLFLGQLVQQPYYQELYQRLTESERAVLQKVNTGQ